MGICASLVDGRVECTLLLRGSRGEDLEGSSYLPKNQSACIAFANMSRGSGMVSTQKYFECSCLLQSSGGDWEAIHRCAHLSSSFSLPYLEMFQENVRGNSPFAEFTLNPVPVRHHITDQL